MLDRAESELLGSIKELFDQIVDDLEIKLIEATDEKISYDFTTHDHNYNVTIKRTLKDQGAEN